MKSRSGSESSGATPSKVSPVSSSKKSGTLSKSTFREALEFGRFFTRPESDPLRELKTKKASSKIKDTEGNTFFEMKDIEVPEGWSQLAIDILVSKYFRKAGVPETGHEVSIQQVITRLARTLAHAGLLRGYFDSTSAKNFEAELSFLLVHQYGAFNSPVWFNLGLYEQYGIEGQGGNFAWDEASQRVKETENAYARPQCSACFIQSVDDDLMGIFQLAKNEARLFKYGSGTGTNFSKLRGRQEKLSGGGTSSGLMSFLEVLDRGAGATKSGGTTRRAAKMVCLDMDHPEILDFITWKQREERKVAALIAAGYSSDFNGEAYKTVAGQNSNNSVRVSDAFMQAVESDGQWSTTSRMNGEIIATHSAKKMWKTVAEAAWACADPGVQYDTTINRWHTCANTDRIHASNPCSEYMFLDDTACNLSSVNLVKFLRPDGSFDVEAYRNACRIFITAQEILVDHSSYPTEQIAKNSHDYRPLGLGYANLGTLLMLKGIPYDSDAGRAWAGALTAIMSGHAYAVSSQIASKMGAFAGYATNATSMLKVMELHRESVEEIDAKSCPRELVEAAREDWETALENGKIHGYRNAQVTVLAPTGTIGLLMDCDTTGVEPDFALVKFKKLAGGGYFKIVNQSVPAALKNLGYSADQIESIITYVLGTLSFESSPHVNQTLLQQKGWTDSDIAHFESQLPGTFELSSLFNVWGMTEERLARLGVPETEFKKSGFNYLRWIGLTDEQIQSANEVICGTMTVEGAPGLRSEHLAVFDCANKCGAKGTRFIAPMGHVRMMAAVQPFLSGAISKTVNLPHETTVDEIEEIYTQGWKLGLKAVALYRDGCKLSQPLSTSSKESKTSDTAASGEAPVAEPVAALVAAQMARGVRRRLPTKRMGFTQEASVGGHKVYIRTGEFEDGSLGEIFIDMHKEGAAFRSMMNCFAISISLGLQYGVPLEELVNKFTFTKFDPSGLVDGHPNVKLATSVVDYIFRILGLEYLGRTDFVQVKPKPGVLRSEAQKADTLSRPARELAAEASMQSHLSDMMGDAPPCDSCGHTTVRNGACYKCLNCGNSMGCS
jgi:ribonucleoside-diphosphate reductase alpha chain